MQEKMRNGLNCDVQNSKNVNTAMIVCCGIKRKRGRSKTENGKARKKRIRRGYPGRTY